MHNYQMLKEGSPKWTQKIWDIYQTDQITSSLRLQTPAFIKQQKPVTAANILNMFFFYFLVFVSL